MLTLPPVPTFTTTRLGMVTPPFQLRFEARGLGWPVGHTVRKDPAVVSVTVTLSTTADTPLAGTPPTPVTVKSSEPPGPSGWLNPPVPLRVSRIRAGARLVNPLPVEESSEYQPA